MNDRVSGKHIEKAGDIPTPVLPTEIWLQILENISDPEYLWTTVRQVSLRYKAYVERIFANVYLPQITVSLSLPRRDPSTDALLWAESIPGAQMTLEFAAIDEKGKLMTLVSPTALDYGAHMMSIEILRSNGNLPKQRLDAATAWICIGSNRAKGVSVNMPRSMDWDEDRHVWAWKVNWRKFVSAFYAERRLKREQNQASRRVPTRRREQHVRRR